jgi:hypothetical protein
VKSANTSNGRTITMEKEAYRDNLERITAAFPNKEMLCCKDLMRFTGLSYGTVKRRFLPDERYISVATLARKLS